mmetsp:Transcript_19551/g.28808  ORF Transcript_19551/g.28808 Transcript_19551/m.28808 type:complete len:249 (-) Transcript_19551:19-765(-)
MAAAPSFQWPEKDNFEELMTGSVGDNNDSAMVVVDLIGFNARVHLGSGIELVFPVDLPMKTKGHIEIGCGGNIKDPWVQMTVPMFRVWLVSGTGMMYAAFMERPELTPHLHANADMGDGDFFNTTITEEGSLGDYVDLLLSTFGPKFKKGDTNSSDKKERKQPNWFTKVIVRKLSKAIEKNLGMGGYHGPLKFDASDHILNATNSALGKSEPMEELEENSTKLEGENKKRIVLYLEIDDDGGCEVELK